MYDTAHIQSESLGISQHIWKVEVACFFSFPNMSGVYHVWLIKYSLTMLCSWSIPRPCFLMMLWSIPRPCFEYEVFLNHVLLMTSWSIPRPCFAYDVMKYSSTKSTLEPEKLCPRRSSNILSIQTCVLIYSFVFLLD